MTRFFLLSLFLFFSFIPNTAKADCVNPAGIEGKQIYNTTYKTMQFCDGTNWIAMRGGVAGDNLGDHIALQNLDLSAFELVGNGGTSGISIDADGNIGIGVSDAYYPLDIRFIGDLGMGIKNTGISHASLYIDAGTGGGAGGFIRFRKDGVEKYWINSDGNGDLRFRPNGDATPAVVIKNNGKFGIGVENPTHALDVTGDIRSSGEIISTNANQFRMVYGNYGMFFRNDGSNTHLLHTNSGNQYGGWNSLRPLVVNNASGNVSLAGSAISITHGGNTSLNNHKIINLADPTNAQDAATKTYVDGVTGVNEIDPKIGTLTEGKWCTVSGGKVVCTSDAPSGGSGSVTGSMIGGGTENRNFSSPGCGAWGSASCSGLNFVCSSGSTKRTNYKDGLITHYFCIKN